MYILIGNKTPTRVIYRYTFERYTIKYFLKFAEDITVY